MDFEFFLISQPDQRSTEGFCLRLRFGEFRFERPVFHGNKFPYFALPVDNDSDGNGLHSAGRKSAFDLFPEQRAYLVTDKTVQDAAGLLCVDQLLVNISRMLESFLY